MDKYFGYKCVLIKLELKFYFKFIQTSLYHIIYIIRNLLTYSEVSRIFEILDFFCLII